MQNNNQVDILDSFVNPGLESKMKKWWIIILVVNGVQILFAFYKLIYGLRIAFVTREAGTTHFALPAWIPVIISFDFVIRILGFILLLVIFRLLYKRKRWGWILLFSNHLFGLIMAMGQISLFLRYSDYYFEFVFVIGSIVLSICFLIFLWRNNITGIFGIADKTKKDTAILVSIGSLLVLFLIPLLQ